MSCVQNTESAEPVSVERHTSQKVTEKKQLRDIELVSGEKTSSIVRQFTEKDQ